MIRRTECVDDISVTLETNTVDEMLELIVALEELEKMEAEVALGKEALEEFAEAVSYIFGTPHSATGEALDALAKIPVGRPNSPAKGGSA